MSMNENSQSNIYKRIINKTEDYVNEHLSERITLNDVELEMQLLLKLH